MSLSSRTPPSAMIGTSSSTAHHASRIAWSWGTPAPVSSRVRQPRPGPTPTLIASAPRSRRNCAPSAVATFPHTSSTPPKRARTASTARRITSEWAWAMSISEDVRARPEELGRPLQEIAAGADRRADEEPAPGVLARVGSLARREDVLLGDEAVDAPLAVDERQLLDPVDEHPPLGLLDRDVRRPRHEPRDRGHELLDRPVVLGPAPREVPVREEPRQDAAPRRLLDQETGDVVAARQLPRLADAARRGAGRTAARRRGPGSA